jgi:hypothetical protein
MLFVDAARKRKSLNHARSRCSWIREDVSYGTDAWKLSAANLPAIAMAATANYFRARYGNNLATGKLH